MRKLLLFSPTLVLIICCNKDLDEFEVFYSNDFEDENLVSIIGGSISQFNGSNVVGNYNNNGFSLHLNNVPKHHAVVISFDLYIHDTWDGNSQGVGGPDLWILEVDEWVGLKEEGQEQIFKTTFSNTGCSSSYCLQQSYPNEYPDIKTPRSGALEVLPGKCLVEDSGRITTRYFIQRSFAHKGSGLALRFRDDLTQNNVFDQLCDESWSLDNLQKILWSN